MNDAYPAFAAPVRGRRRDIPRQSNGADALADDEVHAFLAEVNERLVPYFKRAASKVAAVDPLKQGVVRQIASGGKRVRAALCVASCELFGTPFALSLDFAATVEHVHNFTLVHDDIADADPQRRGQRSAWDEYGIGHAINIGDAFIPLAAEAILDSPYTDALKVRLLTLVSRQALEIVEGQNLDLNMRRNQSLTEEDYFACTAGKTGALLVMATVGGALIGDADEPALKRLREFARLGGLAFQIRDDLLDLQGDKGRNAGSDVREGKRTLLVIHAARRAGAGDRRRLFRILDKPRASTTHADVQWVLELFRRTEADTYAAQVATDFADRATRWLHPLPESEAKYRLLRLARYLSTRSR